MHMSRSSGSFNLIRSRTKFSIATNELMVQTQWNKAGRLPNVVTNASIKKHGILRYYTDGLTKASLSYIPENEKFKV